MNTTLPLSRFSKIFFFSVFLLSLSAAVSAQSTTQPLDKAALDKAIYFNKKSGLPDYTNICQQYSISCDDATVLSKYSDQLLSELRRIPGVVDCSVDAMNSLVIVRFPAENAKESRDQYLEKIKSTMDFYHVRFVSYTEGTYKK
jgi:hypothetical protein